MKKRKHPDYSDPAYIAKRAQDNERRRKLIGNDDPVARAFRGDTEQLADDLRARGEDETAWLIERKLQHGKPGRTKGSKNETSKADQQLHLAALEVRTGMANGGNRLALMTAAMQTHSIDEQKWDALDNLVRTPSRIKRPKG